MTSANNAAENTTRDPRDTATQIRSKTILRATQIGFWVFLLLGIIFGIQLFLSSLNYYQSQADTLLDEGFVSSIFPWAITLARTILRILFLGVGTVIFVRKGDDRIGLLTALFLVAFGIGGIWHAQYVPDYSTYVQENGLLGAWSYGGIGWPLLFVFFYVFPDGRFVPRWTWITLLLSMVIVFFWTMPADSPAYAGNWTGLLFLGTHIPVLVIPVWAQIYRYRNVSTPIQRQQTKWVLYAIAIAIPFILIAYAIIAIQPDQFARGTIPYDVVSVFTNLPYILLPVALAFAMLRSRLWAIDLLINRSLAYGFVATVGIVIFFMAVVGLQVAVGQTEPVFALVIAAGFSAAIFNPLYKRAQKLVDRRIYRFRFQVDEVRQAKNTITITNPGALSGKTLGKYQVLDVIGKGGMGEVYMASDGTRTVAIKTLLTDVADDAEIIKRFQREAAAGQSLNHANIASVHDIARDNGTLYIVMDYLPGQDLSAWLKQHQQVDMDMARDIIHDIASALAHAHSQGFVHRDIKPSNIMLVQNEDNETYRAVLMDFGITKMKDANTLTGTGAIGTIDYMAPEQIIDARTVDHRADIYALGVLIYEMLTGQLPFSGGPAQVMFAHIQQPVPDPRDINPEIPRSAAKAIMKAMAKTPEQRFDSSMEMFNALMAP